jgi:hypothetical protein
VKRFSDICFVIERKEADEHIGKHIPASSDACVPGKYAYPADNVAEESLDTLRCEFRDPMVLTAGGRRPSRTKIELPIFSEGNCLT